MPIKLVDRALEAAPRGCNSSEEGNHAGLFRKHDKAKERACCESGVAVGSLSSLAPMERDSWKHTHIFFILQASTLINLT